PISGVRFRSEVGSNARPISSVRLASRVTRKQWSLAKAADRSTSIPGAYYTTELSRSVTTYPMRRRLSGDSDSHGRLTYPVDTVAFFCRTLLPFGSRTRSYATVVAAMLRKPVVNSVAVSAARICSQTAYVAAPESVKVRQ